MLCQPQEVLILGTARSKSPGSFTCCGRNWGQTRKSPGKLPLRGIGRYWFLPTLKDVLGDFTCQGGAAQEWTQSPCPTRWRHQVTFAKGRAPLTWETAWGHTAREYFTWYQGRNGLSVAPTTYGLTKATPHRDGQLVETKRRRPKPCQSKRMWIVSVPHHWSPTSNNSWVRRSPPQWVPMWVMASHYCQH